MWTLVDDGRCIPELERRIKAAEMEILGIITISLKARAISFRKDRAK